MRNILDPFSKLSWKEEFSRHLASFEFGCYALHQHTRLNQTFQDQIFIILESMAWLNKHQPIIRRTDIIWQRICNFFNGRKYDKRVWKENWQKKIEENQSILIFIQEKCSNCHKIPFFFNFSESCCNAFYKTYKVRYFSHILCL